MTKILFSILMLGSITVQATLNDNYYETRKSTLLTQKESAEALERLVSLTQDLNSELKDFINCKYIEKNSDCENHLNGLESLTEDYLITNDSLYGEIGTDISLMSSDITKAQKELAAHQRREELEAVERKYLRKLYEVSNQYVNCLETDASDCNKDMETINYNAKKYLGAQKEIYQVLKDAPNYSKDYHYSSPIQTATVESVINNVVKRITGTALSENNYWRNTPNRKLNSNASKMELLQKIGKMVGRRMYGDSLYRGTNSNGTCELRVFNNSDTHLSFSILEEGGLSQIVWTEDSISSNTKIMKKSNSVEIKNMNPVTVFSLPGKSVEIIFAEGTKNYGLRDIESITIGRGIGTKVTCHLNNQNK